MGTESGLVAKVGQKMMVFDHNGAFLPQSVLPWLLVCRRRDGPQLLHLGRLVQHILGAVGVLVGVGRGVGHPGATQTCLDVEANSGF